MWIWKDEYERLQTRLRETEKQLAKYELLAEVHVEQLDEMRGIVAELKEAAREERARAERAIDSNLIAQNRIPITDPRRIDEVHDPFVEDPAELAAMHKEMKEGGALGLLMRELPENHEWPVAETIGEE